MDHYLPIGEHGLIGDLHTAALVGVDGTIDWYCSPNFDSPSVFAAILDRSRGGKWRIAPRHGGWTSKQLYFPDTNILITRFLSPDGVGEVHDFMPIVTSPAFPPYSLMRRVLCVRGTVEFEVEIEPRFDYGRVGHEMVPHERGAIFRSATLSLALASPRPLVRTGSGAQARFAYRYNAEASPDGLLGREGTFSMCTFWYVEALARAGHLDEARLTFEKMLTYANHLGLFAEEIGPTGEQLGNFPQAFTHLALISAAVNLDRQAR